MKEMKKRVNREPNERAFIREGQIHDNDKTVKLYTVKRLIFMWFLNLRYSIGGLYYIMGPTLASSQIEIDLNKCYRFVVS